MSTLQFTVFGKAEPKGSARAFVPKGWTRAVVTSANPKVKGWQQLVAEAASRALDGRGDLYQGAIALRVAFYLPRPASLKRSITQHLKKPDLDKLVRATKDALTQVVWRDDAQVVEVLARKHYAAAGEAPHAVVMVTPLDLIERTDR